jgi:hypothetical protein
MICEHCKEETGVGMPHFYDRKSGEWRCPSLPPEERQPWVAVRILQAENAALRAEIEKLSNGILRLIKEPRSEINGSAVESALALIASMNLQIEELRKIIEKAGNKLACLSFPTDRRDKDILNELTRILVFDAPFAEKQT